MKYKHLHLIAIYVLFNTFNGFSQEVPNLSNANASSPGTASATKIAGMPINLFRGMPSLTIPVYAYPKNNFNFGISLDYVSGGIKTLEGSSMVGAGWNLNTGGIVTRTVKGMPDDLPNGYLNSPALPTDYRSNGNKYYNDTLDAQQDIFYCSINGSGGKFLIGKNKVVTSIPVNNLKIIPSFLNGAIASFKIIAENGAQYFFNNKESTKIYGPMNIGYAGLPYTSSWSLSNVILPFSKDTIKLNYISKGITSQFKYPQVGYYNNVGVKTSSYAPTASNLSYINKISSITLPNRDTIIFIYSYTDYYTNDDKALSQIAISDTVLRKGYLLNYQLNSGAGPTKLLLNSVTPYFKNEAAKSYQFYYTNVNDTSATPPENARDYWGYFNNIANAALIPPSLPSSVPNRAASLSTAQANNLSGATIPDKGHIYYAYELNDRLPCIKEPNSLLIDASSNTQNIISLKQVFNTQHRLIFNFNNPVSRQSIVPPFPLSCNLVCNIKSTDGNILYNTTILPLSNLFYLGSSDFIFNVPNGNYLLQTQITDGIVPVPFSVTVTWDNRSEDNLNNKIVTGGLRLKSSTIYDLIDGIPLSKTEYKYIREDGKSSGFLGEAPNYMYPYQEINLGNNSTINYTTISSDPVDDINAGNELQVGYSRVEVINGTSIQNLGKTVYEYTDLKDVSSNQFSPTFPYAPQDIKSWAIGYPKKISVYDSLGHIVKRTVNNYSFLPQLLNNDNNKSLKLEKNAVLINGNVKTNVYIAQPYYPSSGRVVLNGSTDTSFFTDGSFKVNNQSITYNPVNFTPKTITATYNNTLGLQLEKRMYYPFDYNVGGAIGILRDSGIIASPIATEDWITGDGNPRMLNANFADLQQLPSGQIVPVTSYAFQSNKPIPQNIIGNFNPAILNRNINYFKPVTSFGKYDAKANLLQTTNNITGISSSVIMDYANLLPIATVSNAVYNDIAYTSFESDGSGNWVINSQLRSNTYAITGNKSYDISKGAISKANLDINKNYIISFWARAGANITINGAPAGNSIAQQEGWNLYLLTLPGITNVNISGTGIIDELRLYPANANMITNTYDPKLGITSSCDANNTISYTEYDNLGRPLLVRDKDKNIIQKFAYSDKVYFAKLPVPPKPYCPEGIMYKIINNQCETAIRVNTSTTKVKLSDVWKWKCVYRFQWSNGSYTADFIEYNDAPCYNQAEI
jgi:hypothetical protein